MRPNPPNIQLPTPGDVLLGKYRLGAPLGEGGMGVVYATYHDLLQQRFAVKFLRPEAATTGEAVARFLNEARAAARIQNEHVGRVVDVGILESGLPYMLLEYLEGEDLAKLLVERGPLPIEQVADNLLQAIEGIAHAHALGIVHRDLKPSNLFLARRPDGTSRVKVLDFGISKVFDRPEGRDITRTNTALGSPLYMSPEQLLDSKHVDHRCDIWALGVVAFELLTGEPPFSADNAVALFAAIHAAEPPKLSARRKDVSASLEAVVQKCLRRLPEERFQSTTELAMALAPFASETGRLAAENAKRILPAGQRAPAPTAAARRSNASAHVAEQHVDPVVETAPAWSRARPDASSRWRTAVWAVVLTMSALMLGRILWLRRAEPVASLPAAPASTPAQATAPSPSAEPAPVAPSQVRLEAPPPSVATTGGRGTAAPSPRRAAAAAPVAKAASAAGSAPRPSSSATPGCDPPYDIDAKGDKIWRLPCLQ